MTTRRRPRPPRRRRRSTSTRAPEQSAARPPSPPDRRRARGARARAAAAITEIAGDSRMSSVSALKARPSTADRLPVERRRARLRSWRPCRRWRVVDRSTASTSVEVVAVLLGDVRHGARVLGEAGAAEAGPGVQELRARSGCRGPCRATTSTSAPTASHMLGDLVDERDLGREEPFEAYLIISADSTSVVTTNGRLGRAGRAAG